MGTLRLTLPLPPSINSQYVTVGRRRVLSKEAKSFKSDVRKLIDGSAHRASSPVQIEAGLQVTPRRLHDLPLRDTFPPRPRRRPQDRPRTLAEALGFDDRMVVDLHLVKQMDTLNPRLEVEIETIADWQFDPQYVCWGLPTKRRSEDGQALE